MAEGTGSIVGEKIEVQTFSCELLIPPDGIRSSNPAPSFPKRPCSVLQCNFFYEATMLIIMLLGPAYEEQS